MAFAPSSVFPNLTCSVRYKSPQISAVNRRINPIPAARDRVVDFGKYKGKMLGTLPPAYLQWVSKNLRSVDSMHWATLADQVLEDPIYQDRIEWEFAYRMLSGDRIPSSSIRNESAAARLVELSERFGWDFEDKIGWGRVNFELLGTSKGGRIPRIATDLKRDGGTPERRREEEVRVLSESEMRRKERRERKAKLKKVTKKEDKLQIIEKYKDDIVNGRKLEGSDRNEDDKRFPGRQLFLKKVLNYDINVNNNRK